MTRDIFARNAYAFVRLVPGSVVRVGRGSASTGT
jgi:hypothetical protein